MEVGNVGKLSRFTVTELKATSSQVTMDQLWEDKRAYCRPRTNYEGRQSCQFGGGLSCWIAFCLFSLNVARVPCTLLTHLEVKQLYDVDRSVLLSNYRTVLLVDLHVGPDEVTAVVGSCNRIET